MIASFLEFFLTPAAYLIVNDMILKNFVLNQITFTIE